MQILLTTTTVASANLLRPKIARIEGCFHQFCVADHPVWIRKFLYHWRPCGAFFLESEIWPNIIGELYKRKIPIFLLNARLSQRSFCRWLKIRGFLAHTLKKFTMILAQSEMDRERYARFSSENVVRMDNLKYANDPLLCDDNLLEICRRMCVGRRVLVAASTHEGEEKILLEAHCGLRKEFNLITIIIPRHVSRVDQIYETAQKYGAKLSLRSHETFSNDCDIFCVDTFGEVGTFFQLADICFVGGSLVPVGGHNICEPALFGKPVLHGPFIDNARESAELLKNLQIAFEVRTATDICYVCEEFWKNPDRLIALAERAATISKNRALAQIDEATEKLWIENI
jgi:3-deoxy-D-manno-octulosonic-acid transferase